MLHPLLDSLSELSDTDVETKISELGKKFWQTTNPQVKDQIASVLEIYKEEAKARRAKFLLKQKENNGENDLDNLINIS